MPAGFARSGDQISRYAQSAPDENLSGRLDQAVPETGGQDEATLPVDPNPSPQW